MAWWITVAYPEVTDGKESLTVVKHKRFCSAALG